jgi:rare lipoprotein A
MRGFMLIQKTERNFYSFFRSWNFGIPAVPVHAHLAQKTIPTVLVMLTGFLFAACGTRTAQSRESLAYYPRARVASTAANSQKPESPFSSHVVASWYGPGYEGHRTATGEPFDPNGFTAASKTLPLGSIVRVTNVHNGRSVDVRINDRGPVLARRSIDLSPAAAKKIGLTKDGVERVRITMLRD